jgi:hypothetical protein
MDRLLNVIAVFSLILIALVLSSVRREHIRVEYSVSWLLAAAALLVLSRWRSLVQQLANALGTSDVAMALVITSGAVFVMVVYRLSLRISGLKDANIKLAQHVAILEYRLESLGEKMDEKSKTPSGENIA